MKTQIIRFTKLIQKVALFSLSLTLLVVGLMPNVTNASIELANRYDDMSNSGTGSVATHTVGFTFTNTTSPVGSITIQFCSNGPDVGASCTVPTGLDLNNIPANPTQTGQIGFTASANNSTGTILLSRSIACVPGSATSDCSGSLATTVAFTNVINPTVTGTDYLRLQTFTSTNGSGSNIESGGVAIAITPQFNVTTEVPPYLTFCNGVSIPNIDCSQVNGDQLNFGNFSTRSTSAATSQFLVATNAANGYSVTLSGTTMTSGNNVINQLTVPTSSQVGTSQFGLNLTSNSNPSEGSAPIGPGTGSVTPNYAQPNRFLFNSGDTVATSVGPSDYTRYTVSYLVNVNSAQPEGVYSATISYICLANF